MSVALEKPSNRQNPRVLALEKEIQTLETQLQRAEVDLNAFTNLIRARLANEISQLNQLAELYKAQRKAKKEKRKEQKRKGKNYQEPKSLLATTLPDGTKTLTAIPDQLELKRLYKEAIVRVHPDKFVNEDEEKNAMATDITTRLNALYQSGDLELLRDFHEHILSGNAMSYVPHTHAPAPNPEALYEYLLQKRDDLKERLENIRESRLYEVLITYSHPASFIEELRPQFQERILTLKKRTRS